MLRLLKKKQKELQKQNEKAEKQLNELNNQIYEKQKELVLESKKYAEEITKFEQEAQSAKLQKEQAEIEYQHFLKSMEIVNIYKELEEVGFEYTEKIKSLDQIESQLIQIEQEIGEALKCNNCLNVTKIYTIDNSSSKGRTFQTNYGKNLIIGLNATYNKLIKSKIIKLSSAKEQIKKSYEKYNKQASLLGINISKEYCELLLKAIELKYQLKEAKKTEQEAIKREKQRIKEQEKMLIEAEKERKRLEEERKAMDIAFNTALTEEERESIKQQIADIDKRIADVDYRCTHYQCGFLYVIASPALPNMYKVGVTRRMPWIRCKELSSSSLPWEFELKAYCFNDDVFELENKVHKYLDGNRVNKDREFFYGEPKTVIDVLKEVFKQKVKYGTYQEGDNDEIN